MWKHYEKHVRQTIVHMRFLRARVSHDAAAGFVGRIEAAGAQAARPAQTARQRILSPANTTARSARHANDAAIVATARTQTAVLARDKLLLLLATSGRAPGFAAAARLEFEQLDSPVTARRDDGIALARERQTLDVALLRSTR